MGQHRTNPVAIAAAAGDISKADRKPTTKTPPYNERFIEAGGKYIAKGRTLLRAIQKVRGKANAKRAKKVRRLARLGL